MTTTTTATTTATENRRGACPACRSPACWTRVYTYDGHVYGTCGSCRSDRAILPVPNSGALLQRLVAGVIERRGRWSLLVPPDPLDEEWIVRLEPEAGRTIEVVAESLDRALEIAIVVVEEQTEDRVDP